MNVDLYCQEFKRAISMCPKDRKKWAKLGRNGQKKQILDFVMEN